MNKTINDKVEIKIARIRQLAFRLNEHLFKPGEILNVRVDTKHTFLLEKNVLDITLRITFQGNDVDEPVIQSEIQNVFIIKDLKEYVEEGDVFKLPSFAFISMMSLSISHSRALLANLVDGTVVSGVYLPILDGAEVARNHFGEDLVPQLNTLDT